MPTSLFHDAGPLRAGDLPGILFTEDRPEPGVEVRQRLREPSGQSGACFGPAFRRAAPRGAVFGGREHREPRLHHAQIEEWQLLIHAHFQLGQMGQGLTLKVFSQSLLRVFSEVLGQLVEMAHDPPSEGGQHRFMKRSGRVDCQRLAGVFGVHANRQGRKALDHAGGRHDGRPIASREAVEAGPSLG